MLASGLIWREVFQFGLAFGFAAIWFGFGNRNGSCFSCSSCRGSVVFVGFSDLDYMFSAVLLLMEKCRFLMFHKLNKFCFYPIGFGGIGYDGSLAVLGFGLWHTLKVQTR